jgi:hypothetical protein
MIIINIYRPNAVAPTGWFLVVNRIKKPGFLPTGFLDPPTTHPLHPLQHPLLTN